MPVTVQIDGVGKVQLDDGFQSLPPDQQQATIDEIAASAKRSSPAASPSAPAPSAASSPSPAPKAPRGDQVTYQAIERFVKSKYPQVKFTSDYRDPQHNKEVGGVDGSYHTTRQAVDMTGLDDKQREALKQDLIAAGASPREFLFHNAGSGMHLHVAADHVSDDFLKQWGPQAAPAPDGGTTPTDASPDRKAEIESALAQATGLLQAGKEKEAIDLLAQHRLNIRQGELEAFRQGKRSAGFKGPAEREAEAAQQIPEQGGGILNNIAKGIGDSAFDLAGLPGDAATWLYNKVTGNNLEGTSDALKRGYDNLTGTSADRSSLAYSAGNMAGGSVLPEAGLVALGLRGAKGGGAAKQALQKLAEATARHPKLALASAAASGVGGAVGGEAGDVIDPGGTGRAVGTIAGSLVGGGMVAGPKAASAAGDARYINRAAAQPEGKYLPGAVEALVTKARDVDPKGIVPKGRGKLTTQQINAVAMQHLKGKTEDLTRLEKAGQVEPEEVRTLKLAIQRKDEITQSEIDALKGSPEGNAVAEALNHYRAVKALAKPFGGTKPGKFATVFDAGLGVAGAHFTKDPSGAALSFAGPFIRSYLRKPGDVNASIIRGADKAINKRDLFDKLGQKVGPSPVGPAMDTFNQRVADTFAQGAEAAPKQPKLSQQDALIKVNIDSGIYGRHNMYADSLGVKRSDVEAVLPKVDTSDISAFEMEKFTHGYPISKAVRTALLPRLRKALADEGISPATASNQAAKAHPEAEGVATSERIYRPVEDQARYDVGKTRSQALQKYERSQFETQMPKEIVEATKPDIDHIIDVARTGESGLQYFDTHTATKLRQMGLDDAEISDVRSHIERIVSHKRYQTEAAFDAGAKRK